MKEKLESLLKNSYAPYSGFHFACIVEGENGKLYNGVNIENASFGGTICAERNAINAAVSDGVRKFKALYLMSDKEEILMPCHLCKQTFLEFFDKDVLFNIMNKNGEMKIMTFESIMNTVFSKEEMQ